MAEQKKAPDLNVYLLNNEYEQPVQKWLASAAEQTADGFCHELVKCEPAVAAKQAVFSGMPLVLAGPRASLEEYFASLGAAARRVLEDCAYCWTLSDTDCVIPAVAAIAKAQDRTVALSWQEQYYNYVLSPLRLLNKYTGLAGLSISTDRTRHEIERIANADQGAFSPVLILGDPGSGKEVVSKKLWEAYRAWRMAQKDGRHKAPESAERYRFNMAKDDGWVPVACGWFGKDLLQDQLFGHERGAFTGADQRQKGLLETGQHGCIFLDDFDVAPSATLGALLRVMSTDWGEEASFPRLGGTEQVKTNAWLLFATNADIPKKIAANEMRPDFVYRFEDRVIHLRPLARRPADIPQIALKLWETIWRGHKDPVGLGPSHIELLLSAKIAWPGNIRQLRALLSLAASRQRLTHKLLRTIIAEILALGDYNRWVGIVLDPESRAPADPEPPSCLTDEGALAFRAIFTGLRPTARGKAKTDKRDRLANIIEYVHANGSITAGMAQKLNSGSPATGPADLNALAGGRGKRALLETKDEGKTFTPVNGIFR